MRKILQVFAMTLMAMFIFTNLGYAQFAEQSNVKPNQVELSSKDADLLWGHNWEDPSATTNGIVSTLFGGRPDPGYVVSADDIIVPEGKVWAITSIWARGFLSFDDDGNPWAFPDGFGVRIYEDDGDVPGDLIIDYLVESPLFDEAQPEIDFSTPIELTGGKYWVGVYAYFESSTESVTGRWNQYMWNPEPAVETNAVLRDYTDVFGMADSGWMELQADLGIAFTALDFAVWGTESDDDNGDDDTYHVTFNVDMTEAEDFDPAEHHVFLTGTFTGWAEPGSEESVQMELVVDAAKDAPPYTLYENFDDFEDFTTDLSPWITIQTTSGVTWGVGDFDFPGEGEEWAWMAFNPALTDPPIDEERPPIDGVRYGIAIQYMDIDDDKWLISPEVSINETSELSFWGRSHTHAYGAERIIVAVSTGGTDPMDFMPISEPPYIEVPTEWTEYTFDLSAYAGQTIHFAINYVSEDAFIFMIDAISLTAEVDDNGDNGDDPETLIYTATVEVPEGVAEYKYFSDAYGAGWAGGEWEGDPNREILVEGDMVVNDIWADIPNTIVEVPGEDLVSVYPNPASTVLNIRANGNIQNVAVYDITGRIVLQQTGDVVNVSGLRNGLYIIQVNTDKGVESHRFHVVK